MGTQPNRSRAGAFALATLLLGACGGHKHGPTTPPVARPEPRPPAVFDTSPMAAPETLVATVRVARLSALLVRLDSLLGASGNVANSGPAILSAQFGSARAALVDLDGPFDAAGVHVGGDDAAPGWAFAVRTANVASACERAAELGLVCEPREDGSVAIGPSEGTSSDGQTCALYPTAAGDGRLACAADRATLDAAGPYLARTLPLTQVADFTVQCDVAVEALRARGSGRFARELADARSEFDRKIESVTEGPRANERVKEQLRTIVHALFDEAQTLANDVDAATLVVRAEEAGLSIAQRVHAPRASGALVAAYRDAVRPTSSAAADLVSALPRGAAMYGLGVTASRALAPLYDPLVELARRLVAAEGSASEAELEALAAALRDLSRLGTGARSMSLGYDAQGRPESVSIRRFESEAAAREALSAVRALVTALRAPGVARALEHLVAERHEGVSLPLHEIKELPLGGLPRGSFAARLPRVDLLLRAVGVDEAVATVSGGAAADARNAASQSAELVGVVRGTDLVLVIGHEARARYRAMSRTHPAPIDPASLASTEATYALSIFPGEIRIPDEATGRSIPMRDRLGSDAARARVDVRLLGVEAGGGVTLGLEVVLDSAALRAVAAMFGSAFGAAAGEL